MIKAKLLEHIEIVEAANKEMVEQFERILDWKDGIRMRSLGPFVKIGEKMLIRHTRRKTIESIIRQYKI